MAEDAVPAGMAEDTLEEAAALAWADAVHQGRILVDTPVVEVTRVAEAVLDAVARVAEEEGAVVAAAVAVGEAAEAASDTDGVINQNVSSRNRTPDAGA